MTSQTSINLTGDDPRIVCSVPICIGYGADIDKARSILIALAGKHPHAESVCGCPLTQVGSSGMVLTLDVWCADALAGIALRCDLLEQATRRFAAEGIVVAFPPTIRVLNDVDLANGAQKAVRPV